MSTQKLPPAPESAPIYTSLRNRIFSLAPAEAGQEELTAGRHPLAPLFLRSDDVVAQVRRHSPQEE